MSDRYCENCGIELIDKRKNARFCSKSCAAKTRWETMKKEKRVRLECAWCKETFQTTYFRPSSNQTCSLKCRRQYNNENRRKREYEPNSNSILCQVDGCTRGAVTKGFCNKHYLHFRRNIDQSVSKCKATGCEKNGAFKDGYCEPHARRRWKNQDPNAVLRRTYQSGDEIIDKDGYVLVRLAEPRTTRAGKRKWWLQKHRLVMESQIGRELMFYEVVHHRDRNKQNNHPDNLELWLLHHPPGARVNDL